jgi:hypothetical protein
VRLATGTTRGGQGPLRATGGYPTARGDPYGRAGPAAGPRQHGGHPARTPIGEGIANRPSSGHARSCGACDPRDTHVTDAANVARVGFFFGGREYICASRVRLRRRPLGRVCRT